MQKPLVRVNGELQPTSWEDALDIAAAVANIESGDKVLVYSDRVPVHKDTIHGVGGKDFQFSDALNTEQPSNAVQARVVDNISGNYNYKLGSAKIKKIENW